MNSTEIDSLFRFHKPNVEQGSRMTAIRTAAGDFARHIYLNTPVSAEQTLAIRALHMASMHAVSAIALNEDTEEV